MIKSDKRILSFDNNSDASTGYVGVTNQRQNKTPLEFKSLHSLLSFIRRFPMTPGANDYNGVTVFDIEVRDCDIIILYSNYVKVSIPDTYTYDEDENEVINIVIEGIHSASLDEQNEWVMSWGKNIKASTEDIEIVKEICRDMYNDIKGLSHIDESMSIPRRARLIDFTDKEGSDVSTGYVGIGHEGYVFENIYDVLDTLSEFFEKKGISLQINAQGTHRDDEDILAFVTIMQGNGAGVYIGDLFDMPTYNDKDIPERLMNRLGYLGYHDKYDGRVYFFNMNSLPQNEYNIIHKEFQKNLKEFYKRYKNYCPKTDLGEDLYMPLTESANANFLSFDDDEDNIDTSTGYTAISNHDNSFKADCQSVFKYGGDKVHVFLMNEELSGFTTKNLGGVCDVNHMRVLTLVNTEGYKGNFIVASADENVSLDEMGNEALNKFAKGMWGYCKGDVEHIDVLYHADLKGVGDNPGVLEINADKFVSVFGNDVDFIYPTIELGNRDNIFVSGYSNKQNHRNLYIRINGRAANIETVMSKLVNDPKHNGSNRNDFNEIHIEITPTDTVPRHMGNQPINNYLPYYYNHGGFAGINADVTYIFTKELCEKLVRRKDVVLDISKDLSNHGIKHVTYRIDPMAWWYEMKDLNINIVNDYEFIIDKSKFRNDVDADYFHLRIDIGNGDKFVKYEEYDEEEYDEKLDEGYYIPRDRLFGDEKQPVLNIQSTGHWDVGTRKLYLELNTGAFEVGKMDFQHWPYTSMKINGEIIDYFEKESKGYYPMDNFNRDVSKALKKGGRNVYVKRTRLKFPDKEPKDSFVKGLDY